jgi:hypothetical protein
MGIKKLARFLFSWKGKVDRRSYAFVGVSLFFVKWNLDRLIADTFIQNDNLFLLPLAYLIPTKGWNEFFHDDKSTILAMSGLALPFIYIGIILTIKRLRAMDWPLWLAVLFFAPFVNLLFFLLLTLLRERDVGSGKTSEKSSQSWLDQIIPHGNFNCAALASGFSAMCAVGIIMLTLEFSFFEHYGWGFFVGLPFAMGLVAAVTYGHHQERSLGGSLCVAVLAAAFAIPLSPTTVD